jgi:hypothetical protein
MINLHSKANSSIVNLSKKLGFFDVRFLTNWREIVGEEIANSCTPYKIIFDKFSNDATLMLISFNPHFKSTFTYHRQNIINKIQFYFGINKVKNVKIITNK